MTLLSARAVKAQMGRSYGEFRGHHGKIYYHRGWRGCR